MKTFDEKWVELMLTNNLLKKKDIISLAEKFNLEFEDKNWKKYPSREIGIVLMFEAETKKLLKVIDKIVSENYPSFMNYKECKTIYSFLNKLNKKLLYKILINIARNNKFKEFLMDPKFYCEINKKDLIFWIIQSFYGKS